MLKADSDTVELSPRDHSWNFFEYSASQRMEMLRFYLTVIGGIATGVGFLWQAKQTGLCLLVSVFGSLASFCFVKLDFRSADLAKLGELAFIRGSSSPESGVADSDPSRIFWLAEKLRADGRLPERWRPDWGQTDRDDLSMNELFAPTWYRRCPYTYDDNIRVLLFAAMFGFIVFAVFFVWKIASW